MGDVFTPSVQGRHKRPLMLAQPRIALFLRLFRVVRPIACCRTSIPGTADGWDAGTRSEARPARSEEHTSELQSLMRISYAVFCLKKKKNITITHMHIQLDQTRTMQNTSMIS